MVSEASSCPICAGVKTTPIVQLAPAAKVELHVVFSVNSELFVPLTATPEIVMGERIAFVTVTVSCVPDVASNCAPKTNGEGERVRLSPPSKTDTVYGSLPDPPDESVTWTVKSD